MGTPSSCPGCGALVDGERCGRCGTRLPIAVPMVAHELVVESEPVVETQRKTGAAAYLALEPSETAVLHAASRIFASFVARGEVTAANEHDVSDRAVRLATRMALVIEKYIQSDSEDW